MSTRMLLTFKCLSKYFLKMHQSSDYNSILYIIYFKIGKYFNNKIEMFFKETVLLYLEPF